jgi:hypothetical protein
MTAAERRPEVEPVMAQLKDFQRESVDNAFRRLYTDVDATSRFLIADEVGLGKTLIARGIVAKAVDHLWDEVPRIDVLYICSNLDIARQNVSRLKLPGRQDIPLASRITLLPTLLHNLEGRRLNFISFTPGTSLDPKSSMGTVEERALLLLLLERVWGVRGKAPLNLLQGGVHERRTFENWVDFMRSDRDIDEGITAAFGRELGARDRRAENGAGLRERFEELCGRFSRARRHDRIPWPDREDRKNLIADLRTALASTCVTALEPDLVILDEFQRFKSVMHGDDAAADLARDLFTWQCDDTGHHARVLLLSATPYKMYTVASEGDDDDHHRDFRDTLDFLYQDEDETAAVAASLRRYKEELLTLGDDGLEHVKGLRDEVEGRLKKVISRTERLAASPDRNGMLVERPTGVQLQPSDVHAYLAVQGVARELGEPDMIEYWKSAPYLLNFMDAYKVKRRFNSAIDGDGALADLLSTSVAGLLPWNAVRAYEHVDLGNPRMRSLADEMVDGGAWRMLWLAPSLPYYELGGAFATPAAQKLTKRLVFSSWQMVPKAIASLLTYAAEREMMQAGEAAPKNTPEARATKARLLDFREERGRQAGMPVLALLYPSTALAEAADPLAFARERESNTGAVGELVEWAERRIERKLMDLPATHVAEAVTPETIDPTLHPFAWQGPVPDVISPERALHLAYTGTYTSLSRMTPSELIAGGFRSWHLELLIALGERHSTPTARAFSDSCRAALTGDQQDLARDLPRREETTAEDERWYWAAPILLDVAESTEQTRRWWSQADLASTWAGNEAESSPTSRWNQHVELARDLLAGELRLGRQPADLSSVLALYALAGPAVTALRAIVRACGPEARLSDVHSRNAAARTSWGMRSLFNVPEVITAVRASNTREPYWRRVLSYCLEGGLQAVFDEYAHVLVEHLGLIDKHASEIALALGDEIRSSMTIRPAGLGVDAIDCSAGDDGQPRIARHEERMRARFAARFGDDASEEGDQVTRAGQLRSGFNSPFWPFVLATTSVGQEGLDFHLYCHAVVHWNLPSNPVDLEQREGRVHRYKGHAVRRNLAMRYGLEALAKEDPWKALFEAGCRDRRPQESELVPFWIYPLEGGAQVERHVPALPYSRDATRLSALRRSLAVYRMAFGQSRQDDLVEYLLERLPRDRIEQLLDEVSLDLSPKSISTGRAIALGEVDGRLGGFGETRKPA